MISLILTRLKLCCIYITSEEDLFFGRMFGFYLISISEQGNNNKFGTKTSTKNIKISLAAPKLCIAIKTEIFILEMKGK